MRGRVAACPEILERLQPIISFNSLKMFSTKPPFDRAGRQNMKNSEKQLGPSQRRW